VLLALLAVLSSVSSFSPLANAGRLLFDLCSSLQLSAPVYVAELLEDIVKAFSHA